MADNQIAAVLFAARNELNDLQRESVRLAGVLNDPDDPDWVKIDQRIGEVTAKIRRLETMQAAGKVYASKAAVAELQIRREEAKKQAAKLARSRIDLACKIDKAIATVGDLLEQWAVVGAECHGNAALLHSSDDQPAWQYAFMAAARGDSSRFSSALHWALFRAGIGRKFIFIEHNLGHRQIGEPLSMEEAARYTADQLDAQLHRSLEKLKVE